MHNSYLTQDSSSSEFLSFSFLFELTIRECENVRHNVPRIGYFNCRCSITLSNFGVCINSQKSIVRNKKSCERKIEMFICCCCYVLVKSYAAFLHTDLINRHENDLTESKLCFN